MSIARQLELTVIKLRGLMRRNNGDILAAGPALLDDMEAAIEQVHGLEEVVYLETELVKDFQQKGESDVCRHP